MKNLTLKRIWMLVSKSKKSLFAMIFCSLSAGAASLFIPFVTGMGIDFIIEKGNVNFSGIFSIIMILVALLIINSVLQWIFAVIAAKISYGVSKDLRTRCFNKLMDLPLKFFDQSSFGDIMSRFTNDAQAVSEGISQTLTQLFSGIVTIIGSAIFMLILNPVITLVIIALTPLYYLIARFIAKRSSNMFKLQQETVGELSGYAEEYISGQVTVRSFGYEDEMLDGFDEINTRLYGYGQKAQFYSALVNPSTRIIVNTAYILVGAIGVSYSLYNPLFTVGAVSAMLTYANQYSKPINELTGILTQLQTSVAAAKRIFDLADEAGEEKDTGEHSLENCRGEIEFKDVKFSYEKSRPLITGLNLKVLNDQRVAIVGPTGAGKTTLVNLLMRFYEISEGKLLIDGKNIRQVKREDLRSRFSMVLQETWLFSGTIHENIAFSKPSATRDEVIAAAKSAHAHKFIERLSNGYDTIVSEDGGNLSQGQKQLITIARAMMISPPMLILDEATSSVDTLTEMRISRAFNKLMKGKTSFVIAHRLSTIRDADIILFMKDGDIVEQGSHDELIKKDGFYAELYKSQFVS